MEKLDELLNEYKQKTKKKQWITTGSLFLALFSFLGVGVTLILLPIWILTEIINNLTGR